MSAKDSTEFLVDYSYIGVRNPDDLDSDGSCCLAEISPFFRFWVVRCIDIQYGCCAEIIAQADVWQLNEPRHAKALRPIIEATGLSNLAYVIAVDLSQPHDTLRSLDSWLSELKGANQPVFDKLPKDKQQALLTERKHALTTLMLRSRLYSLTLSLSSSLEICPAF